jgi:predicted dehydrogenase
MTAAPPNPLFTHPTLVPIAGEIARGVLGQRLAAYATARAKPRSGDPLIDLGAPLLDYLLTILDTPVASVLATNERLLAQTPDAWFLTLRLTDGLIATIDLGTFLPASSPLDLELRLELHGTDHVITADPANVAVTITGPTGLTRADAYPDSYDERLAHFADAVRTGEITELFTAVIDAARRSAETGEVITL